MINIKKINLNLFVVLGFFVCFLLGGCGNSGTESSTFSENIYGYNFEYNGKTKFERVQLNTDDLEEIVDLFQEVGDNAGYRDSILIAKKYAQGLGANAFSQNNLDTIQEQGLTLSGIQKTQIGLRKNGEKINGVLVDYEIIEGLLSDFPLLYVSQLFIPEGDNMVLVSFITENQASHLSALDMFKNIK